MAIRREDLVLDRDARVLRFPAERAAARLRRRRMLEARRRAALVAVAAVVVVGVLIGGGTGGTAVASKEGAPETVVLQPGETLWDVAVDFAPSHVDPRVYVDTLQDLNHITGAPRAGMQLQLPR